IRTDQGPEFTGKALDQWAYQRDIKLKLIQPGKPTQVESQDWAFGGGGNEGGESFSGFICHSGRGTLAEPDLLAIQEWSKKQNWIKT
ncbi:TPA: DUF469 family protein, partial [Pseudomonas aeruginosa]|nr:DUF469 family protein [Pseudomonas aeruginosa]